MWTEIASSLPVILSLIVLEGLLSVDNALGIAAMARHLPARERELAMRWGIFGAYLFRGLALAFASSFVDVNWVRWLGAGYLLYLMCHHFAALELEPKTDEKAGNKVPKPPRGLFATIMSINLLDLSLSVDNVLAAVALDKRFWVICTGVFIGILVLRFAAGFCIKLIERHPVLEHAAFLLIGYVGFLLIFELTLHVEIHSWQKFLGVVLILAASLLYSARSNTARQSIRPVLLLLRQPMRLVSAIVGGTAALIAWPFQMLFKKRVSA